MCNETSIDPAELIRYDWNDFEQFFSPEGEDYEVDAGLVVVGELRFDASAEPPPDKLKALIDENLLFSLTWDFKRVDKPAWSDSEYNMNAATFAAVAGWSHQEVCDLIIAQRRRRGADLKLGQRCYEITIGKAFGRAEKKAKDRAEAAEAARGNVEDAIRKAQADGAPSAAFKVAADLAAMDFGDRADAIAALKETLGTKLNVRELKRAVNEAGINRKKQPTKNDGLPSIIINGKTTPGNHPGSHQSPRRGKRTSGRVHAGAGRYPNLRGRRRPARRSPK